MDEDEEEILVPSSFDELKKIALGRPEFVDKFKTLKNITIKPENLGHVEYVAESFTEQLSFEMKNLFSISTNAEKEYLDEWTKMNKHTTSTMFDGLKSKFEAVAQSNQRMQITSSQILAYLGVVAEKLSSELNRVYSGEVNIEEDKADKLLKAFDGMQKLLKDSEPLIKELRKQRETNVQKSA